MRCAGIVVLGLVVVLALPAPGCATTGAEGEGDRDLPSAGVGPFRRLADAEVPGIAPFVLEDREARYREPAAVLDGGDVVLFVVAEGGVIVRTRATDGRSFFGTTSDVGRRPREVLAPSLAWEGAALARPCVVRRGPDWLLYYAAAGGIGLARSSDGLVFTREPRPVLSAEGARGAWETTPPRAPGAWVTEDGRVHLLYAAGVAIGEAESDVGLVFRRRDGEPSTPELDPVLAPRVGAFDGARLTDPWPLPRTTPVGRAHLRVLYTGEDASGATSIGFAGRFGEGGPLERQPVPVYAAGQRERAPSAVVLGDVTLLYVGQDRRLDASRVVPGIAAAVAPADRTLPAPAPFPDGP